MIDAIVYGAPPVALAEAPANALQVSPLFPGADQLEALQPGGVTTAVVAAPPGTIERRYVLALTLRSLAPGGKLTALAAKDKGGSRLRKELEAFGCAVEEVGRQHQRICYAARPAELIGVEAAISAGGLQKLPNNGLWTQPGVFSWDRMDPGSQLLIATLPSLKGSGADLGCGLGILARKVLDSAEVKRLHLVDLDRRAVEAAKRNVDDTRAAFFWSDARTRPELEGLDFVVMNPPFHTTGVEDKALGQAFIRRAHQVLRPGGALWMVANRHLPYEEVLNASFSRVLPRGEGAGFKIYEARK